MHKSLIHIFPYTFRHFMQKISWEGLEEIRVRIGLPIELIYGNCIVWMTNECPKIERQTLDEMLNYMTDYSFYALEEEIRQGYLTMEGGHRIGLTGHTAYGNAVGGYEIRNMVDMNGFNIRIAHEKKGCANEILPYINNQTSIYNTILFAAPGVGKTTYLRDCIRQISNGENRKEGLKVAVVDERSEIGACCHGKPQNDLGNRTDILDACPKVLGMKMLLRSMSPQVIAVDELGKEQEFELIEEMHCCGVKLLGTMHAGSIHEVLKNPNMKNCLEIGAIERFVELIRKPSGERSFRIYDARGKGVIPL